MLGGILSADDEITLPLPTHPKLDMGLMGLRDLFEGAGLEGEPSSARHSNRGLKRRHTESINELYLYMWKFGALITE